MTANDIAKNQLGSKTMKLAMELANLPPTFGYSAKVNPIKIKGAESKLQRKARRDTTAYNIRVDELKKRFNAQSIEEIRSKVHEQTEERASDKKEQQNIKKGIQGALGGSSLKLLSKIFGLRYGVPFASKIMKELAIGNALYTANKFQASLIGSEVSGASIADVSNLANALAAFGGGTSGSIKFWSTLNRFTQGSLVGKGLGAFQDAAMQYGLNLSGSGKGGVATKEELIERISNMLAKMSPAEAADFADTLGMDSATFMLLRGGYEKYKERMAYAGESDPIPVISEKAEELAENMKLLGVEFNNLRSNFANTDIVRSVISTALNATHEMNRIMSRDKLITRLWEKSGGDKEVFLGLLKENNIESIATSADAEKAAMAAYVTEGFSKQTYEAVKTACEVLNAEQEKRHEEILRPIEELKRTSEKADAMIEDLRKLGEELDKSMKQSKYELEVEKGLSGLPYDVSVKPVVEIIGNMRLLADPQKRIYDIISDPSSWAGTESVLNQAE